MDELFGIDVASWVVIIAVILDVVVLPILVVVLGERQIRVQIKSVVLSKE